MKKFNLVLDLDETLIHCSNQRLNESAMQINLKEENFFVHVRPFAMQFIESMSEIFHVHIFTASQKEYADLVIAKIDPKNLIRERFYRSVRSNI